VQPDGNVAIIRIWDVVVRLTHWTLVASVALAWLTSEGFGRWHEYIGYLALAVAAVRIIWGFSGSRYARFSQFVRSVRHTLAYARSVIANKQRRYIGHNPMAVALLISVLLTCATGWLYTTDQYWGVEWVEELHETMAWIMVVLIALHIIGAIATSRHHKENLVLSMVHGKKRAAGQDDIA
jgi:cytochrome b